MQKKRPAREGHRHEVMGMDVMNAFNKLDKTFKVLVIALIVLVVTRTHWIDRKRDCLWGMGP